MSVKVNEVMKELQQVKNAILGLFWLTNLNKEIYSELDELVEYEETPDGRMYRNEYNRILDRLDDIKREISYLERPITHIGHLRLNDRNHFELVDDNGQVLNEYHCGSGIEALIYDEYDECDTWVISRVEHTDGRYYIVEHKSTDLNGLKVRVRGEL